MALIKPKQIEKLFTAKFLITGISAVASTSSTDITARVINALSTAGINNTPVNNIQSNGTNTSGAIVTPPNNKVELYLISNNKPLVTSSGFRVYGRLSYSRGLYILSYFYLNDSNVETSYTLPSNYTLLGVANYMFPLHQLPAEKIANPLINNFENPVRIANVYGAAPNMFVTTSSTGSLQTTYAFDAASIPFNHINFTSTNVADALVELYNNPIPSPINSNLVLGDGYVVKASNGNAQLDLRYLEIDNNALLSANGDFSEGYINVDSLGARLGIGTSILDITSSQLKTNLQNILIGFTESITIKNNSSGAQTTQNAYDALPVALATRNITINAGIVNSVALGGNNYTVDDSNTAYTPKLALVDISSGFKATLSTTSLTASRQYTLPDANVNILGGISLTSGKITKVSSGGSIINSLIEETTSGELAIGTAPVSNTRLKISAQNLTGTVTGLHISTIGNLSDTNIALSLDAANATNNNYALVVNSGHIHQIAGSVGIGITPDNLRKVYINTIDSQYALDVTTTRATGTSYAGYFKASGASSTNIALYAVATGATNNYAAIFAAGQIGIGTSSPHFSAILEISSTDKGILFPRMTTIQRDAIISPATGLFIFNQDTTELQFYNGTTWTNIGGGGIPSLITQNLILDASYYIETDSLRIHDSSTGFYGELTFSSSSSVNRTLNLPDIDGTLVVSSYPQSSYMTYWNSNSSISSADMVYDAIDKKYGMGAQPELGKKLIINSTAGSLTEAITMECRAVGNTNTTNIGLHIIANNAVSNNIGVKINSQDVGVWVESGGILISNSYGYTTTSAALEINSTTQGLLLPRMTEAQKNAIASPVAGLLVYDTTNNKLNYYNGTSWVAI